MTPLSLTITCVLFAVAVSQEKVLPLKNILTTLHREPVNVDENISKYGRTVEERWIEQRLDHFENDETTKWQMRYLVNEKYHRFGGPMFIFVGGEWEISETFLLTGHMHDMAREHGGILFYTEHRYYGKSWPIINSTKADLTYLNSRQALADLAHFIRQQKVLNRGLKNSQVILTGGSYSGSLVSYFSKLYPRLATASWASSAPIFAKADFYEYLQRVGYAIEKLGGSKCLKRIQNGIESLHQQLTSQDGAAIKAALKMCPDFDAFDALDIAAFFNNIGNHFAALVQSYTYSIKPTCDWLLSVDPDDDLSAFTKYLSKIFWPALDDQTDWCIDLSYSGYKQIFNEPDDYNSNTRAWFHQTCNEFGWYTTSTPAATASTSSAHSNSHSHSAQPQQQLFGPLFNLSFFAQLCTDIFGTQYTVAYLQQQSAKTNSIYAADGQQQSYENVIMTHGQLDPWRAVGLKQEDSSVFVIPAVSHTADLSSINVNDSIAMNLIKLRVASFVRRHIWRTQKYSENITVIN